MLTRANRATASLTFRHPGIDLGYEHRITLLGFDEHFVALARNPDELLAIDSRSGHVGT